MITHQNTIMDGEWILNNTCIVIEQHNFSILPWYYAGNNYFTGDHNSENALSCQMGRDQELEVF